MPAGLYEHLLTEHLECRLATVAPESAQFGHLDPSDAHEALTRHITRLTSQALRIAGGSDQASIGRQVKLANQIVAAIAALAPEAATSEDAVMEPARTLLAIEPPSTVPGPASFPERPATPLSTSALLVNGRGQPRIGYEVTRELGSADDVDLLCAFIKWQGLRVLEKALLDLRERGGRLRVITTTYMGATDQRALDRLVELGAEVKISYETRTTRLHAKAWLFRRVTGMSTAYVGSSNLSRTALIDGLEWNVRLSNVEQAHLLETFAETFDSYWADGTAARVGDRLGQAA